MAFPQSFMDELVARNPIDEVVSQYVSLTRRGSNYFGLCPFHNEKTGSFSVAPEKGIYYCFGCHKGGGVVNFVMEIESLDFPDAVRFLAKRAGMEVPEDRANQSTYKKQERLWELSAEAARFFHGKLKEECGKPAREYLAKRGMSGDTVTRFGLGYAPDSWNSLIDALTAKGYQKREILDAGLAQEGKNGSVYDRFRNRVMYPIINLSGKVIGFGGRVMDNSLPKYLNSPETLIFNKRKNLFGLNIAKKTKQDCIILCEGYMDAIALHQYGFDCAVASLGTALTEEQAQLLGKYTKRVVLTYDNDEAGQNATKRAIPMLEKAGLEVRVLRVEGAKDPDEFLKAYGADRFRLLLSGSRNQAEFRLESIKAHYNLQQDDERVSFLKEAAAMIADLPSAVERDVYGSRAAEAAGVSPETMALEVKNAFRRKIAAQKRKEEEKQLDPIRQLQPQNRNIRYDNTKSALAEERVLSMLMRDNSLFSQLKQLQPEHFTVSLFSRAYRILRDQYDCGSSGGISAAAEQFSAEEMQHLSSVYIKYADQVINEEELAACARVILGEYDRTQEKSTGDLMAMRDRLRRQNGLG